MLTSTYSYITPLIALKPAGTPPPSLFLTETATSLLYTLSLHDALPISSLTISTPVGTTSGDVMIAHVVVRTAGNTITAPGWIKVLQQDTSSAISTVTYMKVAGSSEPASYVWSFGTAGEASGGIDSYIGGDTS